MPDKPAHAAPRVRAAICPVHGEARVSSPQVSQVLRGHLLAVLETSDDWRRVRAEDGYEGWVHRGYLDESPDGGWDETRVALGCSIATRDGGVMRLPLGARLRRDEQLLTGEAIDSSALAQHFGRSADAIVTSAERFFTGTSYQWGGVTPWGADCSGLTQAIYGLHGVRLPRDAWQQAEPSVPGWTPVEGGLEAMAAGDLLFFSDRPDHRITHVGIASAADRMMHLALGRGGWRHERLADEGDGYVRALRGRLTGVRRLSW